MDNTALREAQNALAMERGELTRAGAHLAGEIEDLKMQKGRVEAAQGRVKMAEQRVTAAEERLRHIEQEASIAGRLAAATAARAEEVRHHTERKVLADAAVASALKEQAEADIALAAVGGGKEGE